MLEHPELSYDLVHVWCVNLDLPTEIVLGFEQLLCDEEVQRAARFRFDRDRRRFIIRHGNLRLILSRYLEITPVQISYIYSSTGKPALDLSIESNALNFNLSSSGDLALIAIAMERRIGVDIESMRLDYDHEKVAGRYFSKVERSALARLPQGQKAEGFFNCWTRKEAYIKARGEGLLLPLDSFDVSLIPGEEAKLLGTRYDPEDSHKWRLHHLDPAPGYVGAVAVEGDGWQLRCWRAEFSEI